MRRSEGDKVVLVGAAEARDQLLCIVGGRSPSWFRCTEGARATSRRNQVRAHCRCASTKGCGGNHSRSHHRRGPPTRLSFADPDGKPIYVGDWDPDSTRNANHRTPWFDNAMNRPPCNERSHRGMLTGIDHRLTHLAHIFDLFAKDSWRNVYGGELEVRPPGAPTTRPGRGLDVCRTSAANEAETLNGVLLNTTAFVVTNWLNRRHRL